MAKIDYSKIFLSGAKPTSIGGQAVMDGVMMQGPDKIALAMRLPNGEIYLKTEDKKPQSKIMKVPFVRGVFAFFSSLITGMKKLMESAEVLEENDPEMQAEELSKFEMWLERKFGKGMAWNFMLASSVVVSVLICLLGFVIAPTAAVSLLKDVIPNPIALNVIEGFVRIALFIIYILAIGHMEDIKKLFMYHGAEHKTIHCFENGLELTPENARTFYTLHPRCGTSFLVFVLVISLVLFSLLGWPNLFWRITSRILLLPVIAGVSYELLKWAGRSDCLLVKILSYPGLMLQKLTTREPDDAQLEIAIAALKAVLPPDGEAAEVDAASEVKAKKKASKRRWAKAKAEAEEVFAENLEEQKAEAGAPNESEAQAVVPNEATAETEHRTGLAPDLKIDFGPGLQNEPSPNAESYSQMFPRIIAKRYEEDAGTVKSTVTWGENLLALVPNGKNEASQIFSYITGMSRTDIILKANEQISEDQKKDYEAAIRERLAGKPLQYITKVQEFMNCIIRVNPKVLIPRLDTEILAENAINALKQKNIKEPEVLDMCTGSGVLGITIAYEIKDAKVTLADIDQDAMSTAIGNAQINDVFKRCSFVIGNMFDAVLDHKKYDIIVSNPPYIETDEIEKLTNDVKNYEPRKALDGGKDGLDFYRIIAERAGAHLDRGGILALEIGHNQGETVPELLAKSGDFENIRVIKDLNNLDRVVMAERK